MELRRAGCCEGEGACVQGGTLKGGIVGKRGREDKPGLLGDKPGAVRDRARRGYRGPISLQSYCWERYQTNPFVGPGFSPSLQDLVFIHPF